MFSSCFFLICRCGRRYNSIFNYLMGGTVCIITAFIPVGYYVYEWPIVLLALLGKYASQVRFILILNTMIKCRYPNKSVKSIFMSWIFEFYSNVGKLWYMLHLYS